MAAFGGGAGLNPAFRLALLSDSTQQASDEVYRRMLPLFSAARPRMAYLPSDFARRSSYFFAQQDTYQAYGIELEDFIEASHGLSAGSPTRLRDYDGVHLSGGQTPRLLKLLRESGVLAELQAFARSGGVLAGVSAGAILMTPSIDTAQAVGDDFKGAPENRAALGLVDFHFWPHYELSEREEAQALAQRLGARLYAVPDGSGLIVANGQLHLVGPVETFEADQA